MFRAELEEMCDGCYRVTVHNQSGLICDINLLREETAQKLAAQINAGAEAQDAAAKERERIVRLCERAKGIIITHGTVASALLAIDDVLGAIRGDHESEVGG